MKNTNEPLPLWDLFTLYVRLRTVVRGYIFKSNDPDFHEFDIHNYMYKMSHYKVYTVQCASNDRKSAIPNIGWF